ncbi:MAG TPA: SigB/SigF/SigG family RNA polymerase sigma factor [Acidimicrobiales bacterium]|nr:SigB/SigF/SigG family RNA polymerase sigma factor [Acidimicrobiales bacterium]
MADSETLRADTARWFEEYQRTGDREVRNRIVEAHRHIADYYVRRYERRGVPHDDLLQVSLLSIVRAAERFDPARGVEFSTFAGRTIEGELKRFFRDRTWSIRPPRRVQELHLTLRRAQEEMAQTLGRSPTVRELARVAEVSQDEVLEALEASSAHQAASLDRSRPTDGEDDGTSLGDRVLADDEGGFDHVDRRDLIQGLLATLSERDRQIIEMRFFENMTQPEIAEKVGVSQSYLSRVLRRTLLDLREQLQHQLPA